MKFLGGVVTKSNNTKSLQKLLKEKKYDGIIIPSQDAFQSEFVPKESRRLEWITGFSGSAGSAIILQNKCAFFTDGRYTLQAKQEVDQSYKQYNISEVNPWKWLSQNTNKDNIIYFDPWLYTEKQLAPYHKEKINLQPLSENIVDILWEDKPKAGKELAYLHPIKYSGKNYEEKISKIIEEIHNKNIDACLISSSESICWLLNIRGNDADCTPLLLSYALIKKNDDIILFTDPDKISEEVINSFNNKVKIIDLSECIEYLNNLDIQSIWLDSSTTPIALINAVGNKKIIREDDPCLLPKSCKNQTEQKGAINAHIKDGLVVSKFIKWVKEQATTSELECSKKLLQLRKEQDLFQQPSFESIVGFKENGAIVHYRVTERSNKKISGNGLLLVDSGGQYLNGTTDVTRTISIGDPTEEEIKCYTLVLKGHIALARATFPKGTTGSQLDVLARNALWQNGLDYDHGTGHGVGSYLGVHEGPQRISKSSSNVALEVGMIISNEPGYYKTGEFGIRIENLIMVEEKPELSKNGNVFLGFKTITCAPLEDKLIDKNLLNEEEKTWLESYTNWVNATI